MTDPAPRASRDERAARGGVNAAFGLMIDNISGMILMATLPVELYGFPPEFVLQWGCSSAT